jgi:hypothetical protein
MMKIDRIGRVAFGALFALAMGAAGAIAADDIPASQMKAARAAIKAIKITEPFDNILPNIAQQIKSQMIQGSPNNETIINDTVDATALKLAARRADLENEAATIYAKTFSEEELNAVAAFYNSPAGQKLLKDGPLVIRQLSKAGDIWASGIGRDLSTQADAEVQKQIAATQKKK